jgi:hypothetical protein
MGKPNRLWVVVTLLLLTIYTSSGQNTEADEPYFDEISIVLNVQRLGFYDLEAVYYDDQLYLPFIDLFTKLGIYITHTPQIDTISGYIFYAENSFFFDVGTNTMRFNGKDFIFNQQEVVSNFSDVFIPIKRYTELFDFAMSFDFRALTLTLASDIELPIIKKLRLEKLRENVKTLTGETPVDTTFARKAKRFSGAALDWNFQSVVDDKGKMVHQLRTAVGAELFGGELTYRNQMVASETINRTGDFLIWRYINNYNPWARQVEVGSIQPTLFTQTSASFNGVRITNTPNAFKRAFGAYTIQKKTNPGWSVELYINSNLIDFATADANGDFTFDIPLVFGNSVIQLRYYSPWGDENEEEIHINIPFNFTPHKKFEYQFLGGVSNDSNSFFFNQTRLSYGLNKRSTVTFGYEAFEGNLNQPSTWFSTWNLVIGRNTLVNYTFVNRGMHSLSVLMRTKKKLVIDTKVRNFLPDQELFNSPNAREIEVGVNSPLLNKKLKVNFRNAGNIAFSQTSRIVNNEAAFAFFYRRTNLGVSIISSLSEASRHSLGINGSFMMKNNISLFFNMFSNLNDFQPNTRIQIQKRFNKKYFLSTSLGYDTKSNEPNIGVSFFMELQNLRSSSVTNFSKQKTTFTQNVLGGISFNKQPTPIHFSNRNAVGRAGLDVLVFLDINHNGIRDKNEPLINSASVALNKGQRIMLNNDTVHRFVALEPFAQHVVTVANAGFPFLSWELSFSTIAVFPNPNQIAQIYIPVLPMGQIEAIVQIKKGNEFLTSKKLIIYLNDAHGNVVHKGVCERSGYFFYSGLQPGKYTLSFDANQLAKLNLLPPDSNFQFEINQSFEGDFIDGVELFLFQVES